MHRVTEILKKTLNSYSMRSFVSWQITQKSDNYVYYKKGLSNNEQQTGEPVQQSPQYNCDERRHLRGVHSLAWLEYPEQRKSRRRYISKWIQSLFCRE